MQKFFFFPAGGEKKAFNIISAVKSDNIYGTVFHHWLLGVKMEWQAQQVAFLHDSDLTDD